MKPLGSKPQNIYTQCRALCLPANIKFLTSSLVVLPADDLAENKWKTKNFPTSTITFGTMQVFQDHKILVMAHSPLLAGKST